LQCWKAGRRAIALYELEQERMMRKHEVLDSIRRLGLLAVLRGPTSDLTLRMVETLVEAGVHGIEITYSTPNAADVVRELAKRFGGSIVLGMGTLTEPGQASEAQAAGAQFLVSPHTDSDLATAMAATGLPFMLGALSPSEVRLAHRLGSNVVKLFPGSLGGPGYLKALKGPFPGIAIMPTGGVSTTNIGEWFGAGAFAVGAGGELCPVAWAQEGRFDQIGARARQFLAAVEAARRV
jgi:2-dehydro-3-deoxyphosphogluconate aldolase/(4S)-4-hydroxy-2-oxoglutarate aldolase